MIGEIWVGSALFHHREEWGGNRGLERHQLPGGGMDEHERARMEGQAVDRGRLGAVTAVAAYGVAEIRHVDADLVLAAGLKLDFGEGESVGALEGAVARQRGLPLFGVVGGIYLIF